MKTAKSPSADSRPVRRRVASSTMPSSPRQSAGRRSGANASQVQQDAPVTVPSMMFKVKLRRLDSGEIITLGGFIRLTAHGSEQPEEIGRMPAGSRITWAGSTWEVA